MKTLKKSGNMAIVAMLVVAALIVGFWVLLLSPKREEAAKLGEQVEQVETSLAQHEAEAAEGEEARKQFPVDYQKLVVLGKAVPQGDETASLLVQMNTIARRAEVKFRDITLSSGGSEEEEASAPATAGASATEATASLLPLGASIGPAGLAVMPYSLTFDGSFFQIADFIEGLDSMVKTHNGKVNVDGRLVTIGGFSLAAGGEEGGSSSALTATFTVTTYLTPPGQGLTAGASAGSPTATATPAAATLGGAP
jgi:Tfp pilus assembly protein PilO